MPLGIFPSRPFSSFDLGGPWRSGTCLASKRENARIMTYLIFGHLHNMGVDLRHISVRTVSLVYRLIYDWTQDDDTVDMMLEWMENDKRGKSDRNFRANPNGWSDWLRDGEFRSLIYWAIINYPLNVVVPDDPSIPRGVIKIAYDEPVERQTGFLSGSGIISSPLIFTRLVYGAGQSLHARFVVPRDMRVEYVKLRRHSVVDTTEIDFRNPSISVAGNLVSIYAPPVGRHEIVADALLYLNVRRGIFTFPALFLTLISLFCATIVVYGVSLKNIGDWSNAVTATVAAIGVLPAIVSSYLFFNDEHEYVSVALGARRLLLVFATTCSLLLSLSLGFGLLDGKVGLYLYNLAMVNLYVQLTTSSIYFFDVLRVERWRHFNWRYRPLSRASILVASLVLTCILAGVFIHAVSLALGVPLLLR